MTVAKSKKDRAMTAIFSQLEMLQELACDVEETELANDLSAVFANALVRYCHAKRLNLSAAIDNTYAEIRQVS